MTAQTAPDRTRILVFGTGAVGCVFAYVCCRAEADLTVICRSNYSAVQARGITIKSALWGTVSCQPRVVGTIAEAAELAIYDFILVCSKAVPGTANQLRGIVSENTTLVLAHNGIAIENEYAAHFPQNTIISGANYFPVTQTRPGHCVHGPLATFEMGTFPANAPLSAQARVEQLSRIFTAGGAAAPVFDDIQSRKWMKLGINIAWLPTTALSLCDDANFLRSSPEADDMIVKIYKEVGQVATAAGYADCITDEEIARQLQRARHRSVSGLGAKESSMLADVRRKRRMEVEAVLGNTVRIARQHGVEAKYLELLYVLAKARDFEIAADDRWIPLAE